MDREQLKGLVRDEPRLRVIIQDLDSELRQINPHRDALLKRRDEIAGSLDEIEKAKRSFASPPKTKSVKSTASAVKTKPPTTSKATTKPKAA